MAGSVDGVDIVDAEMERHLKRAIDQEDAKVEPKKTKTGDDILPEISIDEDMSIVDIPCSRDVPVVDSFCRLQINPDLRGEKEAVMARVAKDNNNKKND